MLMMNGLRGLGDAASCSVGQQWDPNYVMPGLPPGQCTPWGSPMSPKPDSDPSWWQSAITAVTQGAAAGLSQKPPAAMPALPPPVVETPWYTTPMGLAGIGGAVLVLFLMMRK